MYCKFRCISYRTPPLLLWDQKDGDGCCDGHLHRWTALSASVPAHSNTSRHPVGRKGGGRLLEPLGWVTSGQAYTQDTHSTGWSTWLIALQLPRKKNAGVHRLLQGTTLDSNLGGGGSVAGPSHKFCPLMSSGDSQHHQNPVLCDAILNPTTVPETQTDVLKKWVL